MNDPLRALGQLRDDVWLVGGAVRDRLLGRPTTDFDVVLDAASPDEVERLARGLGRRAGGFVFSLSDAFGAWRVVDRNRRWQVDLMAIEGGSIESDLGRRDLTVNAMAEPLSRTAGEIIDPFGGLVDLEARRLRRVSSTAFESDPLRVLRLARLACQLDFAVESGTAELARRSAPGLGGVAPERVFAELRALICSERPLDGLSVMDAIGATDVILPELSALRGIEQSRFHHLDVLDHTRQTLAEIVAVERRPSAVFGDEGAELAQFLAAPLANEMTRGQALRLGGLLHDIGKPETRAETAEGRISFMHHDEAGAVLIERILGRLRASERLIQYVAALARHHLRLGFLVHRMPLERRDVYRYLRACDGVPVDVTILSVADRLATRGENSERAIQRHLELARQILPAALEWAAEPPRPPVRGDELAAQLGMRPGPRLGQLLRELEEAAYAGEVSSPEEAVGYARELLQRSG